MSGPRGHGDLQDGSEDQRILRCADVERDLFLVDKLFVKPAGFATAENVRSEIGESVTRLEDGRSEPGFINARQFHLIVNHGAPLRGDGRRNGRDLRDRRTALQWTKIFLDQLLRLRRIKIADDRKARIVGRIIKLEEIADVLDLRSLDVRVGTHNVGIVRMPRGKQLVEYRFFHNAIGRVLNALAAFVSNHVLLVRQAGLV